MSDFLHALNEVRPRFGMDESSIENCLAGGFYNYSNSFDNAFNKCKELVSEIKQSTTTQLLTLLIDGEQGSGKTAVASKLALESGFPFVKFITPNDFVGLPEFMKIMNKIRKKKTRRKQKKKRKSGKVKKPFSLNNICVQKKEKLLTKSQELL